MEDTRNKQVYPVTYDRVKLLHVCATGEGQRFFEKFKDQTLTLEIVHYVDDKFRATIYPVNQFWLGITTSTVVNINTNDCDKHVSINTKSGSTYTFVILNSEE